MSFYAYMLRCADGHYYVGQTDNLEQRIRQHQTGEIEGYTRSRPPVELVWSENFPSRIEALEVERQLKGWSRSKKEALIRGDWPSVSRFARKSFDTDNRLSPFDKLRVSGTAALLRTNGDVGSQPIIVLVRPQLGANIGKAARAMLNFGLTELRLVSPRDGWPNPDAGPAAAGADVVLASATVFDTLADAVADIEHVYATTVRKRGITKPVLTPAQAAAEIHRNPGRSALVFGPERSGLDSDDAALARTIVTVPINPDFGSLNLAQAVILCAYEWSKGVELASPPATDLDPPAPQIELEGLIGEFENMLEPTNYFHPQSRAEITHLTLRNILTKPGWNAGEVRTLRGVLSALRKGPRRP